MMMTMGVKKMPVILMACMLLFSTLAAEETTGPNECCFSYKTKPLPKAGVVKFQRTHIQCARDGVVFTMKNRAKICCDPAQKWVQKLIASV